MRPMSRAFLARQITGSILNAACKGRGAWWSEQEAAHAAAGIRVRAAAAAADALAVCAGCPEIPLCAQRAAVDRYTGLAAGAVYVNGVRKPAATVVRRPDPPHLKRTG